MSLFGRVVVWQGNDHTPLEREANAINCQGKAPTLTHTSNSLRSGNDTSKQLRESIVYTTITAPSVFVLLLLLWLWTLSAPYCFICFAVNHKGDDGDDGHADDTHTHVTDYSFVREPNTTMPSPLFVLRLLRAAAALIISAMVAVIMIGGGPFGREQDTSE